MTNWQTYLKSVSETYKNWWESYTITDVEDRVKANNCPSLLLDLQVETVAKKEGEREEKTERLEILAGARKYSLDARDHVLLQGKPGSGKSTALARLLLESASQSDGTVIPVLVELRSYKTSVIDLMRDFLKKHDLLLESEEIEELLQEKRFFLLIDGINELPSDDASNGVIQFRKTYPKIPMVFTTRELGLRGNLGIDKQLTLQPLSETQMKAFVRGYLGNEELLNQLRNERLQKLGETPLLLLMLCSIYSACGRIPDNLGETFREFTRIYDEKLKADVTTQCDSKRLWADSLQYLSFEMTTRKDEPVIGIQEAEKIIGEFLQKHNEGDSLRRQRLWLEDLVRHHLIQKRDEDNIEFHHQLIQEYYAAESLIGKLASLTDRDLQWRYLNYLKWTEPIALMLGLLKDREQALRVVRLALAVDFGLGARLAGEVNPLWQEETVKLVTNLEVLPEYWVYLLGKTGSEKAVEALIIVLGHEDWRVRYRAAEALGKIGTERAVEALIIVLGHEDWSVRESAAEVLGKIGTQRAVEALIIALGHEDGSVRESAAEVLGKIGTQRAVEGLIIALGHEDGSVRESAAEALGKIGTQRAVEALIIALGDEDGSVRYRAAEALGKIGTQRAVEALIIALGDEDWRVRYSAAEALGKIGTQRAVEALIIALGHEDGRVRYRAAEALGKIGTQRAVEALIIALGHEDGSVRYRAAEVLGKIGTQRAVEALIIALGHEDWSVRYRAAEVLGKIGSERAVERLIIALGHEDEDVRGSAAEALGKIGTQRAVEGLIIALGDEYWSVRESAAEALGNIGTERAVESLIIALGDEYWSVRFRAAEALGNIGTERAVESLIIALGHEDRNVRDSAAEALGKIGTERAVESLIIALGDEDWRVRDRAAEALGKIGTQRAVESLIIALGDEDWRVRDSAAEALGKIGTERAVEPLIIALGDEDEDVRDSAAEALGKIGTEKTIPTLVNNLKNPDFPYPNNTIQVLEAIQKKCQRYTLEPMFLPLDSLIPNAKITDYLLKLDKSKFLARIGFTLNNPEPLKSALTQLIQTTAAIEDITNEYGTFYRVEGELIGINQVRLSVITLWLKRNIDNQFQFITLKPQKEK